MDLPRPPQPARVLRPRGVERLTGGQQVTGNGGVRITRLLTHDLQHRLDPFLLFDSFRTRRPDDYVGGFPERPQRGFESIIYMIQGHLHHQDATGEAGVLAEGGVQWLTIGAGIRHAEMPEQDREGVIEGFQVWLNLPSRNKLCAPWCHDFPPQEIPAFATEDGVTVRVIAGASHGMEGAMQRPATQPLFLDVRLPEDTEFEQPLPQAHHGFVYACQGEINIDGAIIPEGEMAILEQDPDSDGVILKAGQPARALIIAGKPLNEPIVQYGPFVMNTQSEIRQAMDDYREGRL